MAHKFPAKLRGMVEFRYRILPRNTSYDASSDNRFGNEKFQPLITIPVKKDVIENQPVKSKGSKYVAPRWSIQMKRDFKLV